QGKQQRPHRLCQRNPLRLHRPRWQRYRRVARNRREDLPTDGHRDHQPVLTEWGSLIPGLRASRFDLIAAGMYITPERCKQVLFTDPHYQLPDTLLVKTGNPKNLRSYADIANDPEAKLAIM